MDSSIREDSYLFGEAQSRAVVSIVNDGLAAFEALLKTAGAAYTLLGEITGDKIIIGGENWGGIGGWKELYDTAIENYLK